MLSPKGDFILWGMGIWEGRGGYWEWRMGRARRGVCERRVAVP